MSRAPNQKTDMPDETNTRNSSRRLDPEGTKREILRAARAEFAEKGFSGARIEEIGARTKTATRMIYYYFGNKEGLYVAALEQAYADIRAVETNLDLEHLPPVEAMCRLVDFTFDYERTNEDFVRIISNENINHAQYLKQSKNIKTLNSNILGSIFRILERGYADGSFQRRVEPLDLHLMIIGLCFYRVSNQHTFSVIFDCDLADADISNRHKRMIRNTVLSYLRSDENHPGDGTAFEWDISKNEP
jgi:AcrR family transcriptional regulator